MQQKFKTRFAPSPNGLMHFGHAYSALLNVKLARAMNGEFIIRMEDIDQLRCTAEYKAACVEDLAKIGVVSDEQIMLQSERQVAYDAALKQLNALGVLYPCLATRGEIKRHYMTHDEQTDPDGALIYPALYKGLSFIEKQNIIDGNAPYALRLDMQKAVELVGQNLAFKQIDLQRNAVIAQAFDPMVWGDVVIARKDIGTSYHLSVVVDDAAQNISHIVRGVDLYHATYIHYMLQKLLKLPHPVYFHHQLVQDDGFKKLAKSRHSQSLREYWQYNPELDLSALYFNSDLLVPTDLYKLTEQIMTLLHEQI